MTVHKQICVTESADGDHVVIDCSCGWEDAGHKDTVERSYQNHVDAAWKTELVERMGDWEPTPEQLRGLLQSPDIDRATYVHKPYEPRL